MSIKVSESILINAKAKQIFDILWDVKTYKEVFPEIKEVKSKKKGDKKEASFSAELMGTVNYTLLLEQHPPKQITWTLVKGDMMKSNTGAWTFQEKNNKTKLTYAMEVELSIWVPDSIVERLLSKHLPAVMNRLKEKCEKKQ